VANIKVRDEEKQPEKVTLPSFLDRLDLSSDKIKDYYDSFMEYCDKLNVKHTIYKHKVKYFYDGKTIANLYFTHKTLRLFIALNPCDFDKEALNFRDFSSYKKHTETPMSILINSNKSLENSKLLIFTLLSNNIDNCK
jgi:hypothetical protein